MSVFSEIRKVYDKLGDEESREIFLHRLRFSLSGDREDIRNLVRYEMKRYGRRDIMVRLLDWIGESKNSVAIFGAGFAGCQIASVLHDMGKDADCFLDNNTGLQGTDCAGLRIEEPGGYIEEHPECFVVIGTNYYVKEIREQLSSMGISGERIFVPDHAWWVGTETQYFDRDIMKAGLHESFVDGGALDGNDSREFVRWCRGNYDEIHLFEPDAENYRKLKLAEDRDPRIVMYEKGLWSSRRELRFLSGKPENCMVSEQGNSVISVTSIDEELDGKAVTLIKLDIEGSEAEAIKGAEKTIARWKPRLAVCVYHKPEDIVELPLQILSINPDYRFYLRHYSYTDTETVLYAV